MAIPRSAVVSSAEPERSPAAGYIQVISDLNSERRAAVEVFGEWTSVMEIDLERIAVSIVPDSASEWDWNEVVARVGFRLAYAGFVEGFEPDQFDDPRVVAEVARLAEWWDLGLEGDREAWQRVGIRSASGVLALSFDGVDYVDLEV